MTNDEGMNRKAVIPSEVEESRGETLMAIRRGPSTPLRSAQDDSHFELQVLSLIRHSPATPKHGEGASLLIRHYV